jgi:hypothetical protein
VNSIRIPLGSRTMKWIFGPMPEKFRGELHNDVRPTGNAFIQGIQSRSIGDCEGQMMKATLVRRSNPTARSGASTCHQVTISSPSETNAAGYSGRSPTTCHPRQLQKKWRELSRCRTLKPT